MNCLHPNSRPSSVFLIQLRRRGVGVAAAESQKVVIFAIKRVPKTPPSGGVSASVLNGGGGTSGVCAADGVCCHRHGIP